MRSLIGACLLVAAGLGVAAPVDEPRDPGSLAGRLLVASRTLNDPNFAHTIVLLLRHDGGGAMGVIVNRPVPNVPLARVFDALGLDPTGVTGTILVWVGGPVARGQTFVIHSPDYSDDSTQLVSKSIALTTSLAIVREIGAGRGPRRALLALGYAGWAAGQLEAEIDAGAWITVPLDDELVFGSGGETKWQRAIGRQVI